MGACENRPDKKLVKALIILQFLLTDDEEQHSEHEVEEEWPGQTDQSKDETDQQDDQVCLTLCSPSSTIGTSAGLPSSTFGTDTGATQNELNPIVLHLWTQCLCLENSVLQTFTESPIVSYTGELPTLSLLLIFQLGYLGVLTNNLAFTGFSTKRAKS